MMRRLTLLFCCLLLVPVPGHAESLRLEIRGVSGELSNILETALVLPTALSEGGRLNRPWLKRYQRQLPELVNSTLEPYGYFFSRTDSRVIEESAGVYRLQVDVVPGEPLRVTSLDLQLTGPGAEQPALQRLRQSFPLQVGSVLRQDHYEQGKTALLQGALSLGYLDAIYVRHQLLVNRGRRQVAIILQLDSGVRYRFGKTVFAGRGSYPAAFLRRYLSYRAGDYFAQSRLGQTQHNLLNADLFRSVNIHPMREQRRDGQIPIRIDLHPAPRHRLRPGIGYGTDTGARVSLRYRNLNLWQRGHELQGELLLAELKQSLLATYIIPDAKRLDSRTLLRVGVDREETDSYLSRKLFSEGEYQRSFGGGLIGSLFVRLSQEYSLVSNEETRAQMLLPGLRLTWRRVDDPLIPHRGIQTSLELKGGEKQLFSDTSLLQLSGQATGLLPLPQRFSLLLRLQGGTTWHNDPLRELPASLRFFAGGDRSVRGYRYQSLGPRNDQGEVVGGKHLLVANLELEKRLTPDWGVAVFYDIGNAFDSFAEYELEQGAGIGIRRYTRIGPVRLDLARQLGNSKNRYRLHLSVGFGW